MEHQCSQCTKDSARRLGAIYRLAIAVHSNWCLEVLERGARKCSENHIDLRMTIDVSRDFTAEAQNKTAATQN